MIVAPAFIKQLQAAQLTMPPIVLIYGEEPLLIRQSLDAFRAFAKNQDYLQRDTYEVDAKFDWQSLEMDTQAGSLFAERRLIELSMPSGAPGKVGGDFIQKWAQLRHDSPPEIVLVILCEKLDGKQTKSKWVQVIEQTGLVVQSRPIELKALPAWCQQRALSVGLSLDLEAANVLAERVEGNLLAADQEMEKLSLLFAQGTQLQVQDILNNVADQAHYQLFALSTAALTGQTAYALQILNRLKQEGLEAPIILWLLAKEVRTLVQLCELQQKVSLAQAYKQLFIWNSKQAEYSQALRRQSLQGWQELLRLCTQADFEIKGIRKGDAWLSLNDLVVKMAQ
ncbi:DNA polymerase III subunit delta [Thiosulfativibrio zosterae]|uniref:DNA polymerase III subunit delta n=1 Tax=Thiosulfativibrio zosterae TaxID=2675053 RepID=A0A6F8PQ18_9GAMM|nr:DNA polymerase III subunit delta [Thiosulfativibrio zosterae]BBP44090.1 DNA polymerase III subunit delta [Thiosulfativibrio zosterae]